MADAGFSTPLLHASCVLQIRMLLGVLPSKELLQQYKLTEFEGICDAMRAGDVGLLMRTLDAHQTQLVQVGSVMGGR
jgi:hypothetical protein